MPFMPPSIVLYAAVTTAARNFDASSADSCPHGNPSENAGRVAAVSDLLTTLVKEGATAHVPLEARATQAAGLTVHITASAKAGQSILTVPAGMHLQPDIPDEAGLALALLKQRKAPTSTVLGKYIATLPERCPGGVVAWGRKDLELVGASLHRWKSEMLLTGRAFLATELPETSEAERDWALCMVFSRSLKAHHGQGSVMIPFIDLLNHEPRATVYLASYPHGMVMTATKDLEAGDELTWEYVASPSRARLLTSFGFGAVEEGKPRVAPAASIAAKDLPTRDANWLESVSCPTVARTDLEVDEEGQLDDHGLRDAIRCIRLRLYLPILTHFFFHPIL